MRLFSPSGRVTEFKDKIDKPTSQMLPPMSPPPTSRLMINKVRSFDDLPSRAKPKKEPDELLEDIKKLHALGYCSSEMASPIYNGFTKRKGKRPPSLAVSDLWGKRMTQRVIKESGYWEAYKVIKTRGLHSMKTDTEMNLPATPRKMDENARRRIIFKKSHRKMTTVLAKEPNPTIQSKKFQEASTAIPTNRKMASQMKKLLLDCDNLQYATDQLQTILTPPSRSEVNKLRVLSISERRLFDRIVNQL